MASNLFRRLITLKNIHQPNILNSSSSRFYSKIYEPDYLEALKPKYPLYPPLNVQIRGYDYPILENYQGWVHKIAEAMDFDIENCYAVPAKELKITRFKPKSVIVETDYMLSIYERNIIISNVASTKLPIFIRIIEAALPEGVLLDINESTPEKEEFRYIPDKALLDMKSELENLQKNRK